MKFQFLLKQAHRFQWRTGGQRCAHREQCALVFRIPRRFASAISPNPAPAESSNGFVSFNLGPISHPVYGAAKDLTGRLPLMLPRGTFQTPKILEENNPQFDQLVNRIVPACDGLWPRLDKTAEFVKDVVVLVACINPPKFEMHAPQIMSQIYSWCWGLSVDDLGDFVDPDTGEHSNILQGLDTKTFVEIWNYWHGSLPRQPRAQPGFDITASFPHPFRSDKYDAVLRLIRLGYDVLNNPHPELMYEQLHGATLENWFNSMCAASLQNDFRNSGAKFSSKSSHMELRRRVNAMVPILENNAVCHGIKVPASIRKTIFFQLTMLNYVDTCLLQNGLLGLLKDIATGNVEDSPVLSLVCKAGTHDLQSAFGELHAQIQDSYADFQLSCSQLLYIYGEEDENVEKFVELLKYTIDGSLHAASRMSRYSLQGKLTFHV